MPHLMNCSHSGDGWCLDCVKKLYDEIHSPENDDGRTFPAWAIFATLSNGEEVPLYKQINGGFPWFRTRKEAEEFRKERLPASNRWVVAKVKKVTLTMEWQDG